MPDYYLVLTGPRAGAGPSRGTHRPWVIEMVFLFEADALFQSLKERSANVKIGIATSVPRKFWDAAEVYPEAVNALMTLTEQQHQRLGVFGP